MIITGAYNVYPVVVENVVTEHPKVREACVVGIPDDRWGEAVCAVVVGERGLSEEELLAFCRERLAKFEVPKRIDFVDELPRGATGKVLKRAVRDRYRQAEATT
jgi:acyl-CoA synthetase (AMP-forming)/AMP-acid ligase II